MGETSAHIELGWQFWVAAASIVIPIAMTILGVSKAIVVQLSSIDARLEGMDKHNEKAHTRIEKKQDKMDATNDMQWEAISGARERLVALEAKEQNHG